MKAAVDGGAKVVVCAGFLQEHCSAQGRYPVHRHVQFVFIDGYAIR